jgi:hypothetical protein
MLTRFKKRIDDYLNRKFSKFLKVQKLSQQEQFSYAQLSQLFNCSHFIPMTTWSISPSTILHILNDIDINQRRCIVEFGSGISTLYIAKYIKSVHRKIQFYSVESNKEWMSKLQIQIESLELQDYVTLIYAPIEKVPSSFSYKSQDIWYSTNELDTELNAVFDIDVVIVDGPFGGITPYARYSALPFLKNKLASKFSIFIDDVGRSEENEILKEWKNILKCDVLDMKRYAVLYSEKDFSSLPFQL